MGEVIGRFLKRASRKTNTILSNDMVEFLLQQGILKYMVNKHRLKTTKMNSTPYDREKYLGMLRIPIFRIRVIL